MTVNELFLSLFNKTPSVQNKAVKKRSQNLISYDLPTAPKKPKIIKMLHPVASGMRTIRIDLTQTTDIVQQILSYLTLHEICMASVVCVTWTQFSNQQFFIRFT